MHLFTPKLRAEVQTLTYGQALTLLAVITAERKNFAAFVDDFGLGPMKSAMDVYKGGLHLFWNAFSICEADSKELLAAQIGRQRPPWLPPVAQPHGNEHGQLSIVDGNTFFSAFRG